MVSDESWLTKGGADMSAPPFVIQNASA